MPRAALGQRSFDDLGTPLFDVTFCVLDLETTGASPTECEITEIGAAKFRGGECLGTFHTLVNPGVAIPPFITYLTGITEAMVLPAPRIEQVLPSLLEFIGDAVIVGHNIRFDLSFLQAALARTGRPRLANRSLDTCALARRLVRDEVPNCQLGTLAERFRLDHQPSHRALDDALATADLLHLLLERSGTLGVTGLDDLLSLPTIDGHAQASKLRLTADLPRKPGVYLFRDRHGRVLYVGKATNVRARVRSYFSTDERRKVGQLLRETEHVDHVVCANPLHAAVLEVRLIHEHTPRFNRQAKNWKKYCYVKLTLDERFPRLAITRTARDDGALYLGPLTSRRFAQQIIEAIQTHMPISIPEARERVAELFQLVG
ncbi:MAG: DEDD exonuclease domain-containing protein, partial [Acidimicrobiales bacterium]|nr:DEDD exonuclease domain-containing protein [Acidimicrobiales bacterium]